VARKFVLNWCLNLRNVGRAVPGRQYQCGQPRPLALADRLKPAEDPATLSARCDPVQGDGPGADCGHSHSLIRHTSNPPLPVASIRNRRRPFRWRSIRAEELDAEATSHQIVPHICTLMQPT